MYGEFCILLDKNAALSDVPSFSDYGSLLEAQTQSYKLGNIHALLRSYELKADMSEGEVSLLLGDAIYKGKLYQDAHQLASDKVDVEDFVEKARGCYLLIKVDAQARSVTLLNDPLSLYPVYWFENERYAALSNVPIWMETILGEAGVVVERDGLLAGYDLAIGTGAFGVTGWSEFHLIPFGNSATMTQAGLDLEEVRSLDRFFVTDKSLDELIDKSADEIQENVKAIAGSHYENKVSDITGGMDSRLVLSAIFSQGLRDEFLYHTNGEHPVPDANCALSIMERFELTRIKTKSDYSQSVATDPIGTFKKFIYQSQGSRFIYDRAFETNCVQDHLIKVGGGLAGGFKSTYSLRLVGNDEETSGVDDAVSSMFLPAKNYLSESLVSRLERELHAEFSMLVDRYGLTLKSAMDFFYVLSRNRYFIGQGEFPNSAIRPKVHALYSESLISAAMKLSDSERAAGKLHYELMKKLSPELWALPFSQQSWSETLLGNENVSDKPAQAPINPKSPKLYNDIKIKEVTISSVPQVEVEIDTAEALVIDKKWRERQRALGRNWMWRNFDNIHAQVLRMVKKESFPVELIFKEAELYNIIKSNHFKHNRASEVRAVLNLLMFAFFSNKKELPIRISYI